MFCVIFAVQIFKFFSHSLHFIEKKGRKIEASVQVSMDWKVFKVQSEKKTNPIQSKATPKITSLRNNIGSEFVF